MHEQFTVDTSSSLHQSPARTDKPFVVRHAPQEVLSRSGRALEPGGATLRSPARVGQQHLPPPAPTPYTIADTTSYSLGTVGSGMGSLRVKPSMTVVYPPTNEDVVVRSLRTDQLGYK
jgi:hypothetical protein